MTFRSQRSDRSRHLVLRAAPGERLPEGLAARLAEEGVTGGWLRASGVLTDVELRAFDAQLGALASPRRITGPVHLLSLEGGIGFSGSGADGGAGGALGVSLHALLAREGDSGLETLAGEITSARAVALEVFVTVLEDVTVARTVDPATGLWLLEPGDASSAPVASAGPRASGTPGTSPGVGMPAWTAAVEASAQAAQPNVPTIPTTTRFSDREIAAVSRASTMQAPISAPYSPAGYSPSQGPQALQTMPIPQRPTRPNVDEGPTPEAGDVVDHFAFGRCDVVKSDGERLHLRIHKDNRIREIALEMLRVTRLEDLSGHRHFKLERRI